MIPKKQSPRKKLSFAVDREEIEINSDWVNAVMAPPVKPSAPVEPEKGLFFGPQVNNATDAESSTGARNATGEELTTGADIASVVGNTPAAENAPQAVVLPEPDGSAVVESATVAEVAIATVSPVVIPAPVDEVASVALFSQLADLAGPFGVDVAHNATVAPSAIRKAKPRPIRRVTDGLTPGQYAVYSLMYAHGQDQGGEGRLYRGGYAALGALTGLSKRGLQNVVAELQQKGVISIHQAPGHHRTETSIYRVLPPDAVLRSWHLRGYRFAMGKSKTLTNTSTVASLATA
jgi:hypothetical protein